MPGIVSGFILSITLSLDDYIITAFTKNSSFPALFTNLDVDLDRQPPITQHHRTLLPHILHQHLPAPWPQQQLYAHHIDLSYEGSYQEH